MDYELLEKFYKTFDAHLSFSDVKPIFEKIVEKDRLRWEDITHLAEYAPAIVRVLSQTVKGSTFMNFKEAVITEVVLFSVHKDKFESLMKEMLDSLN